MLVSYTKFIITVWVVIKENKMKYELHIFILTKMKCWLAWFCMYLHFGDLLVWILLNLLQLNNDYPDLLGLDEIVPIIKGPDSREYDY